MSQYAEFTREIGERVSEALKRIETAQSDAIAALRERLEGVFPELQRLPFVGRFPQPLEIAQANFALAEQILRAQKNYTLGLLDALSEDRTASEGESRSSGEPDEPVPREAADSEEPTSPEREDPNSVEPERLVVE